MLGSLIGALGTLGASALSAYGQIKTNKMNIENQNRLNDINIELANTAHQREVEDLKAAGLNPILSAGGSGAGGAVQASADIENPFSALADGVNSAVNGYAQRELLAQQIVKGEADTKFAAARAQTEAANASRAQMEAKFWNTEEGREIFAAQQDLKSKMTMNQIWPELLNEFDVFSHARNLNTWFKKKFEEGQRNPPSDEDSKKANEAIRRAYPSLELFHRLKPFFF